MKDLSPTARKFIRDWGDLADRWNLDRTAAEIHALLWLAGQPMDLKSVADLLLLDAEDAARGLECLREAGFASLADRHAGSLRYAVPADPWEMFRAILEERRRREVEPAIAAVRDAVLRSESDPECDEKMLQRLEEMQSFLRDASGFYRELSTIPGPAVRRLLKMGGKIRRALGLADSQG